MERFEVWESTTSNLLANFATLADTIAWLRLTVADEGPEFVNSLLLIGPDPAGRNRLIAAGPGILPLLREGAPA